MVRKTVLILLATFAAPVYAQPNPFDKYDVVGAAWVSGETATNDTYWILKKEIDPVPTYFGGLTFWMRGDHSRNTKLKYRSSLWKISMTCKGSISISAISQRDANGASIYEWDGFGTLTSVRPDTIYASIQDTLCKK